MKLGINLLAGMASEYQMAVFHSENITMAAVAASLKNWCNGIIGGHFCQPVQERLQNEQEAQ